MTGTNISMNTITDINRNPDAGRNGRDEESRR